MTSTAHLWNRVLLIGYARSATYFASQVMLKKHLGVHAAIRADAVQTMAAATASQRFRPFRVAARRQRELMVVIAQRELNSGNAEWVDEDIVDLTDIELPVATGDLAMPTVSVDEHLKSPWSD